MAGCDVVDGFSVDASRPCYQSLDDDDYHDYHQRSFCGFKFHAFCQVVYVV